MEMQCPIRFVAIPGMADAVELKGLIVIVGPNSSGKTQFLHDLNEVVLGRKRRLVVLSSVQFNEPPNFEEYFQLLVQSGSVLERDANNFQKRAYQFGTEQGGGEFHKSNAINSHSEYRASTSGRSLSATIPQHGFLQAFGPLHCTALFLKNRLTLMDTCSNFDHRSHAASKTLQSLHWKHSAEQQLKTEIATTFNRGIWIDPIGYHQHLVLRVADTAKIPSAEDRLQPEKNEEYRGIETEGDGIRSYAAICATLLLERRPLCLIDEPEMCLHPPQAQAIGRFIGKHVTEATCTVVATHSSHVLRGILESNPNAHVIRVSRNGSNFSARLLKPEALAEATSKPRSRSEAILEGLFAQGVILCEAEGDRIVYESTYRTLKDRKLDIRFIPSEGTGGFSDPIRLYAALGVPSAVIADLDFLRNEGEIRKLLTAMNVDATAIGSLCTESRAAVKQVMAAAGCLNATEVRDELNSLLESSGESGKEDALRGKLRELADRMYRLRELQQQGIDSIPEEWPGKGQIVPLRARVTGIVEVLKSHGLFLVPVGVLESWMPVLMNGISREDKSKWAMNAAEKIEQLGERTEDDIWKFVRAVAQFLSDQYGLEPVALSAID